MNSRKECKWKSINWSVIRNSRRVEKNSTSVKLISRLATMRC